MGQSATERRQSARLFIVLILIGAFFFVELTGAKIARSDVLEADAFHLLMDVLAIVISLVAMRVSSRRPSSRFTFGLRRAEPLAALANGVLVLGVAIELVRDAIEHVGESAEPRSGVMIIVASMALVVNGLNAWLLHGVMGHHGHSHSHSHGTGTAGEGHLRSGRGEAEGAGERHGGDSVGHGHGHGHGHGDEEFGHGHGHGHGHGDEEFGHGHGHGHGGGGQHLNLRGAWLHLLGDAMGSFAALVAGLAIKLGAPSVVDPLASLVVVAILVVGALRLLRDAGHVLLEAAPQHLSVEKVEKALLALEGVAGVSALHVWTLGTGHDAITAHVRSSSGDPSLGARAAEQLRKRFTVEYVTIQVDPD